MSFAYLPLIEQPRRCYSPQRHLYASTQLRFVVPVRLLLVCGGLAGFQSEVQLVQQIHPPLILEQMVKKAQQG